MSLKTGYNFGSQSEKVDNIVDLKTENFNLYYGQGTIISLGVGYQFNKYLATNIDLEYLFSSSSNYISFNNGNVTTERKVKSKSFQIKPTFIMTMGYNKINPYLKFGAIISKSSFTENMTDNIKTGPPNKIETIYLFDGGLSFGLTSSLGLNYSINNKIQIFGEVGYNSLSYSPSKRTTQSYEIDGKNAIQDLKPNELETNYSDSFITPKITDENKPNQQPTITKNFSSLCLNFGVRYQFF